ncbi:MAG: AAA family ATPase, partial [Firmicutes bacterium HGW-Firmicutes-13]
DESGKDKGSLVMLEEWLSKNIRTQENLTDLIIKPLKNIRSIRQKPAHELTSNEYDVTLHKKQFDLMNDTYTAIRAIRLFFANHPLAKDVKVPEHLVSGKGIVNY